MHRLKVKCFSYNQTGHYARDCTKPKKVLCYALARDINVASFVFLSKTNTM